MSYRETAITFECAGETMVGIVALPDTLCATGVVIVVGGPQYRAGSHRQFTLLARHLAQAGYPTLRFDYRGMGDSSGELVGFEATEPDIGAAIGALSRMAPKVRRVILWGLCDAAAASLLYWHETRDPRIGALCLLNPWVRSEATLARAQVKHYYRQRLTSLAFWKKLLSGGISVGGSLAEAAGKVRQGFSRADTASREEDGCRAVQASFQQRMAEACDAFLGPILLLFSENDLTAREFQDHADNDPAWAGVLSRPNITATEIAGADHTFSTAASRGDVEAAISGWFRMVASGGV